LDRKRVEDAQRKLEWAIESLNLSIKCMVISYKDEKYKVQFFTREDRLIRAVGFNISGEWIRDTIPMKDDIHGELKTLLVDLEEEAKREKEAKRKKDLNSSISKKSHAK
jgi:hypothetical protein